MSAQESIRQLIFEYAHRMDAGDLEGVYELLKDADNRASSGAVTRGPDYLDHLRRTTRLFPDGTPRTRHVTTNLIIEVGDDGETAVARSYVTVFQKPDKHHPLLPIFAGRYVDRFACPDGVWRFVERSKIADLNGDLSNHLQPTQYAGTAALAGTPFIESAVRQVLATLFRAIDRRDVPTALACFAPDARIVAPTGEDLDANTLLERTSGPTDEKTRHEISTMVVDVRDGLICTETYVTRVTWTARHEEVLRSRYLDDWAPGPAWRIQHRTCVHDT